MAFSYLNKLLEIGSAALAVGKPDLSWATTGAVSGALLGELAQVLGVKNGFVAFESALLVLPSRRADGVPGLAEWNDPKGWLRHYDRLKSAAVFFAQDAFAGQFGITEANVIRLNPETGETTPVADSLEDWAGRILDEYNMETGWSVAREWQRAHGPLVPGHRLLPKRPFVLGGDFVPENLVAMSATDAMEKYGSLYRQVRDIPDGRTATITGWI